VDERGEVGGALNPLSGCDSRRYLRRPARCRRHAAPEALPPNARPSPLAGRELAARDQASGWSPADPRSGQSCNHVVEHPQLVADRIGRYARIVGRENVIPGTDCGLGGRIHPQIAWAKLEVTRAGCGFGKQAAIAGLSLSRFVPKRVARGGADWFGLGPLPVWFQMEVPL